MAELKQDILNEVTDLLGLERWTLPKGGGSSLPSHVFEAAASRVGTRTGSMPVMAEAVARKAGIRWLSSYDSRHTVSGGGSTVTRPGLRAFADALHILLGAPEPPSTFLLTWNPARWTWAPEDIAAAIDASVAGQVVEGRWSTGTRVQGIKEGDRAFLLKQGAEPRGIIASGVFRSGVFQDVHWDGSDSLANFADWDSDRMIAPDDPLPLVDLNRAAPGQDWEPMQSGTQVADDAASILETLWAQHIGSKAPKATGQARQLDAERRKKTEDAAQDRLMQHYRDRGWHVLDTRIGNPFDARATKDGETLYLEAKGTTSDGASVIVSRNEVRWALDHPGQCVIGVWSGIRFDRRSNVDPTSGDFAIHEWEPYEDDLVPTAFDWITPDDIQIFP